MLRKKRAGKRQAGDLVACVDIAALPERKQNAESVSRIFILGKEDSDHECRGIVVSHVCCKGSEIKPSGHLLSRSENRFLWAHS